MAVAMVTVAAAAITQHLPYVSLCDDVTVSFEDSSVVLSTDARGCQPCAHACQVPSLLVALIISDS